MAILRILLITLIVYGVNTQDAGSAANTSTKPPGGYDLPAPPSDSHPAGGIGGPPPPPGGFGYPGLGAGFHKNFDISAGAGFGPFGGGISPALLGLLGGAGGLPPLDGGPPPEGGIGGFPGFGGFGGFGPGYVPSTWVGSALGAKGDLLFPIVIFVFFVVGVWTVIQFLLGFIVPLIAGKLALKGGALAAPFIKRDTNSIFTPASVQTPDLEFITNAVMNAINEPKCLKYVACNTGNFLNSMSGGNKGEKGGPSQYEGILKALSKMTRSETLDLFEKAFLSGTESCDAYDCAHDNTAAGEHTDLPHGNATSNELH